MKYIMLDLETMGTDITHDDIIQIGLLELTKVGKYYVPGRSLSRLVHTDQTPKNDWIAKTHAKLLPLAQATPVVEPRAIRAEVLAFFKEVCGSEPVYLMGLNAMSFDIPFMLAKGFLTKDDYHYRVYELRGAYKFAEDILGGDYMQLANLAYTDMVLPEGRKHEALYDCYAQAKTLNGLIYLAG
jgi:DNA polymerase III epsilon subunit-like protein